MTLQKEVEARFLHGQRVAAGTEEARVAVFGEGGRFLGIGEVDGGGTLRPKRLIVQEPAADAGVKALVEHADFKIKSPPSRRDRE